MHLAREEGRAEGQRTMRMPTGEIPRFSGFGGLGGGGGGGFERSSRFAVWVHACRLASFLPKGT